MIIQAVSQAGATRVVPKNISSQSCAWDNSVIRECFVPLLGEQVQYGYAPTYLLAPPLGYHLVFTSISLVQGLHFTVHEGPDVLAQKALRMSLSELASIGATPVGYTVHIHFPKSLQAESFFPSFVAGLSLGQKHFNVELYQLDFQQTLQDLVIGVTAFGEVPQGLALSKGTAKPGDRIYVTGSVGDAALGLSILQEHLPCSLQYEKQQLIQRYLMPEPRIDIGRNLGGIATSTAHITNGLLDAVEKICMASQVSAYLNWHHIPWSDALRTVYKSYDALHRQQVNSLLLTASGDYELLFTVASGDDQEIEFLQRRFQIPLTMIGHLGESLPGESQIKITNKHGEDIVVERTGL